MAFERNVVVHEIVESLVSHCERKYGFAGVDVLPFVRYRCPLDQAGQRRIKHFGMDSEVRPIHQCLADSARHSTDTDLKTGTIRNKFGNSSAEFPFMLLNRTFLQFQQRNIVFNDRRNI